MMQWFDRFEKKYRNFAIPNITFYIILSQIAGCALSTLQPGFYQRVYLDPQAVLSGEWYRLLTCLIAAPPLQPGIGILFFFFFLHVFWFMGSSLETEWGTFRYNVYLLLGAISVYVVCFASGMPEYNPAQTVEISVFLAFAFLFPNFEFLIFLILPVKVKYLAAITWFFITLATISGDWTAIACVSNFFLFFGGRIFQKMRSGGSKMARQNREKKALQKPVHQCTICGITEKTAPEMEFRYCSKCEGEHCYCMDHILNHEHKEPESARSG